MNKPYRFFHAPVMTFFSIKFYRDVVLNWKGTCLGYLFLLMVLTWIPFAAKIHIEVNQWVGNDSHEITSQIPDIIIKDGKASTDVPQPLAIVDPQTDQIMAMIDTTGQVTSLADAEGALILVTANEVITKQSGMQSRSFRFDEIDDYTFTSQTAEYWLNLFAKFGPIGLYFMFLFSTYIYRIICVLILAAIGLLFVNHHKLNLSYAALMRLSVMAITPLILVNTIVDLLPFNIYFHGLINLAIAILILHLVIKDIAALQVSPAIDPFEPSASPTTIQQAMSPEPWDEVPQERNVPPQG